MRSRKLLFTLSLVAFPLFAHAHIGVGSTHGFGDGWQHPLHGLDHLLAMVAVGLWAAQLGGRATWAIPASFVSVMALGGVLGFYHVPIPMVETGILVSILLLGLLVALAVRVPVWAGALLVGLFAMFHGYAHGTEMPAGAIGVVYATGFVLATAMLNLVGIGLGIALKRVSCAPALRVAGAAVICAGAFVALS